MALARAEFKSVHVAHGDGQNVERKQRDKRQRASRGRSLPTTRISRETQIQAVPRDLF